MDLLRIFVVLHVYGLLLLLRTEGAMFIRHTYTTRLNRPPRVMNGEHIPLQFFANARTAELSKQRLQNHLRNFLEALQWNLTTSTVLSQRADDTIEVVDETQQQLARLHEVSGFFHGASEAAEAFANDSEQFFEVTKNCSYAMLLKLRQVSPMQPNDVKLLLTNYYDEMKFFHIKFSEVLDEALEYTQNTIVALQKTFLQYAELQRSVLEDWNFKADADCCHRYMEFVHQYSAEIFKCATNNKLQVAYDIYAMSEVNAKYVMRQLEFRIQRLFNCFLIGSHEVRCRYLRNAEADFQPLSTKIDEFESYIDRKIMFGRGAAFRFRRRQHRQWNSIPTTTIDPNIESVDCIPEGFPLTQMSTNLRSCFYFIERNQKLL